MACTCRSLARCPICNTPVRVPLSNLESASAAAARGDRFGRRDGFSARFGLRRIIEGSSPCPTCGHSVKFDHSRPCVASALASVGVPAPDRESILARIVFPEG